MDYTCACGKTYQLPEAAAGKRARCRACGVIFTVPAATPAPRPAVSAVRQPAPAPATFTAPLAPLVETAPRKGITAAERSRQGRVKRSFWLDALYSFTIFSKPANVPALVACAFVLLLAETLLFVRVPFRLFMLLFLHGAVVAFYLDVIRTTAGGEDELPTMQIWGGEYWEDIFKPLLQFGAATIVLLAPAFFVANWQLNSGATPEDAKMWGWCAGAAGFFFWPITMLAIAVGGLSALIRIDLLALTILKTVPAYLAVLGLMVAAAAIGVYAAGALTQGAGGSQPAFGTFLAVQAGLSAAGAYVSIVCMRAIGLYYRHFSERFPWTAG